MPVIVSSRYLRDMPVIGEADAERPITLTVVDPGWSGW
jgi:hypothetical protein